jgi:hypothetical protein
MGHLQLAGLVPDPGSSLKIVATETLALISIKMTGSSGHIRCGSKPEVTARYDEVRLTPKSGHGSRL